MNGGGLSKLGTALIAVFAVCLLALVAELVYVLWRRKRFQRRIITRGESVIAGDDTTLSSKELLYLLCWKNQCRIEPQEAHQVPHPTVPDVDDVLKWQELFGPSRVLFTIREEEEEREGLDSENEAKTKRVFLEEVSDSEAQVAVTVQVEEDDGTTPFSTPCDSPLYYTPLPSPARDDIKESSDEEEEEEEEEEEDGAVSAGENVPTFVSLEIHDV